MARNKGRRPADSKPTPESRPASAGTAGAANGGPGHQSVNGTTGAPGAKTPAEPRAADSSSSAPAGASAPGAEPADPSAPRTEPGDPAGPGAKPGDPTAPGASPASANPAGAAQPSVVVGSATGSGPGQPDAAPPAAPAVSDRSGALPMGAAQPSKPGSSPSGGPMASARPPAGGSGSAPGGPMPGRPQSGRTPPPGNGGRGSFVTGLIGGVIGGIVAALALSYFLRPEDGAELVSLRGQVEQLAASVEELRGGSADLDQLAGRIDALEQAAPSAPDEELQARLEALEQTAPSAAELADRIAALETSLAEGTQGAGADERIQALQNELAELSATVAAQAAGEGDATSSDLAVIDTLQARLAALEASVPDAQIAADIRLQLDALAQRVDALAPLAQQSAENQSRLEDVASRIGGLEEQIRTLRQGSDAASAELADLASRLTATEDRIAATGDRREQAAALALLTSQIDSAVTQSRSYDAPLRSLGALGADDEVVRAAATELEAGASGGVPSLAELRRSFEQLAPEIVHSARAPEGDGLLDQAAGNLMRLVTVRPVGADVEGDDAAARVARAEAHLATGDLAAAVAEVEELEGAAAKAAAGWLAEARTRLAVSAALERLQTRTGELLTPSS